MIQFDTEILSVDGIPARLIHPLRADCGHAAVFYHGWSSTGALQTTRAAVLAAHGYTVLLPDAVYRRAGDAARLLQHRRVRIILEGDLSECERISRAQRLPCVPGL